LFPEVARLHIHPSPNPYKKGDSRGKKGFCKCWFNLHVEYTTKFRRTGSQPISLEWCPRQSKHIQQDMYKKIGTISTIPRSGQHRKAPSDPPQKPRSRPCSIIPSSTSSQHASIRQTPFTIGFLLQCNYSHRSPGKRREKPQPPRHQPRLATVHAAQTQAVSAIAHGAVALLPTVTACPFHGFVSAVFGWFSAARWRGRWNRVAFLRSRSEQWQSTTTKRALRYTRPEARERQHLGISRLGLG